MSNLLNNKSIIQELINTINDIPDIVDTSDATATNAHILAGKTAYVNGQKITGTMAFQPAKTITPTTTDQIAVSSGYYTGGNITVNGDNNLIAGNIKSGVSIFGVSGTYVGSGGDVSVEDSIITKTIVNYTNDRITDIGDYVFCNCNNLISVNFPKVTYIGWDAFRDCGNLTTASFPMATNVDDCAFDNCCKLTTISFPMATNIGESVFDNCWALSIASFPMVTNIGNSAFCSCIGLTTANFPTTINIGNGAFRSCNKLTTVNFPMTTNIGSSAFYMCNKLTAVSFPKVTYINQHAFSGCGSLITANFPMATDIGYFAFNRCINLTTISFPMVTYIDSYAFSGCSKLTTVSFPMATDIGSSAFYGCSSLESLYLTGSVVCTLTNSKVFNNTPISTYGSIYVPFSLLTTYKNATNWTYFSSRFVDLGEDFYFNPIESQPVLKNTTINISTTMIVKDGASTPVVTISSDNESIVNISNIVILNDAISFDIITNEIVGEAMITISATNENCSQTNTFNISVLEEIPTATYIVETVENALYGFKLNSNNYYESQNKETDESYAVCKVNINAPINTTMYIDCINYAESSYDYGILSNLDSTLTLSDSADNTNVYHNFEDDNSENIQTVTYNVPAGEHFIYIKFIKDESTSKNNDSL